MSDSFVIDGSLIVLPVADGRFQGAGWMRTTGHNRSLACFPDRTFEGLLHSETCQNLNECNSAIAAGGADQIHWPVSRWLLPLTRYSA
jgi:hypothetical protein